MMRRYDSSDVFGGIRPLQYFRERIMSNTLEENDESVSIGGTNITNMRFTDDIYVCFS